MPHETFIKTNSRIRDLGLKRKRTASVEIGKIHYVEKGGQ